MRGNTRWGSDFAHGSDMLFAVADLANRMLPNTDDAFGSLERVSFIRPVTGHLKLSICDGSKPGAAEPAIAGSFRTINGRKLYFEGVVEPNTRLGVKRQNNIVATEFSQARIHSTVGKGFLISPHRADD